MKRLIAVWCLSSMACFNFDSAYEQYCQKTGCRSDGGAGGGLVPNAGGTAAAGGGAANGGGVATAGGMAAGGSVAAGGSATAGGTASAGGSAGGSVPIDAGVVCAGAPFCLYRSTARTDFKTADAVVGASLTETYGFFSRQGASVQLVEHNGTATGIIRQLPIVAPPIKIFGGSARDFFVIGSANLITAPIVRFIDGGTSATVFRSSMGCAGQDWFANSYDYDATMNRLLVGGRNEGICSVDLNSGSFANTVLQPDSMASPIQYVEDLYATPGGSVYWGTDDGYVGKLGVGRISGQLDPDGIIGIDGTSDNNVWIVTSQCRVAVPAEDGGVSLVADLSGLSTRCYSMKVTTDGVFIGAFEALLYQTRFTDGGFEAYSNLPVGSSARLWNVTGGPEGIHIVGDDGPISNVTQAYYLTLIPRTQ